jgi:uncharacterized HhH-GPD family protein
VKGTLAVTGDADIDRLVNTDPLALLIGMLLDQQVPMEWAFRGPATIAARLDGRFNAADIAAMDPEELVAVLCAKPAVHRYPAAMARRVHALCEAVVRVHGGDPEKVWKGVRTGAELFDRIHALPGYGKEKSQIFVAILAKRFRCRPQGWEAAAGPFADEQPRSVADISSRKAFTQVREWKQAQKAAGKKKSE